jgi:DNA-binding XRE family transcriptional regulator
LTQALLVDCSAMAEQKQIETSAYVDWLKRLGRRIAARRKTLGWTQAQAAEQLAVDFKFYQDLEYGRRPCTTRTLFSVAKGMGTTVHALVPGSCPDK